MPELPAGARTKLVLVRHGQTDWNAGGRFQGQADIPLNRVGRSQAAAVAQHLVRLKASRVVSSDLGRAVETAEAVAAASGLAVVTEPRLQEINVGTWVGRTAQEVAAEDPSFADALAAGRDFRRSETGETAEEAGRRVAGVLAELGERYPGETTLVVGHGLALRVGLALFLGLGMEGAVALAGLWNCSWTILEHTARWRLLAYNNVVPGSQAGAVAPASERLAAPR